jgi:hypothetical protein
LDLSVTVTSVTDKQGNVYFPVLPIQRFMDRTGSEQSFYAPGIIGGLDAVTVTVSAPIPQRIVFIHEYGGFAATVRVDAVSTRLGVGLVIDPGPITTTSADELLFAHAVSAWVRSVGTGFTPRGTCQQDMTADGLARTPGIYQASFANNSSDPWWAMIAAFRAEAPDGGSGTDGGAGDSGNSMNDSGPATAADASRGPLGANLGCGCGERAVYPGFLLAAIATAAFASRRRPRCRGVQV